MPHRHDPEPAPVVQRLRELLAGDADLAAGLERSLKLASARAHAGLNRPLLEALEWPEDLEAYQRYLEGFLRWIPQQSDAEAWRVSVPEQRYAKEVSDRLAHFFWLIDQAEDTSDEMDVVQRSGAFGDWLTAFATQWGAFLDTPQSFSDEILQTFLRDAPDYTIEESLVGGRPNMPSGWRTFNQFFARQLNPGLRPIASPADNRVLARPADSSYQARYGIDPDSGIPETTIKGTHKYGSIHQLLEGSAHADAFAGGTFAHWMLPPSAYHRFHVPVAGRVDEAFVTNGRVFMQVDLTDGALVSRDSATTGYEFAQTRGVVVLDTSDAPEGDIGLVAVVAVGMSHVASVVITPQPGVGLAKGDEFGYFQFGGSDIIVLLQAGVDVDFDTTPGIQHVGSAVGRALRRV